MNPSTIDHVSTNGVYLTRDDDHTVFVHVGELRNALKWIRNQANSTGYASVKGFTVYEDQATDLIARVEATGRRSA